VRSEGLGKLKESMTSSDFEPAIFLFVPECLNQRMRINIIFKHRIAEIFLLPSQEQLIIRGMFTLPKLILSVLKLRIACDRDDNINKIYLIIE
jgi:hypothetical protein